MKSGPTENGKREHKAKIPSGNCLATKRSPESDYVNTPRAMKAAELHNLASQVED